MHPEHLIFHYTSGDGLLGILSSDTIWATSIHHLNDGKEFSHARELVQASGGSVAPVEVSMQATGQAQSASVRCAFSRIGYTTVNYDYSFAMEAVDTVFASGFEP